MSWLQNQQLTVVCVGFVLWTRREERQPETASVQRETRCAGRGPCLDVPHPLGGPARGPRCLSLLGAPAKLLARAGEWLETHQIPWLQHTHEATQGHLPLVSWGPGMGAPGAQAGQATGRTGTRLQDPDPSPRGRLPSCRVMLLGSL